MPAEARIRFESFEVCPEQRQVWKHGTKIKLHGQPFQILLMLLERPGEVVTREYIRGRLWPEETFVDFEHSVNTAVKKLRQALGDSAEKPRYVETLTGVGYRFISDLKRPEQTTSASDTISTAEVLTPKASSHAVLSYQAIGGAVATVLVLGFLAYYLFYPPPAPRATRITEVTHSGKVDGWGGLVFDGARLLFLERAGDHWNFMQTSAKGGPSEPVPVPFRNTRAMDISPDNSQLLIASFIERDADLPIWVMPLQGGPPRRLGNVSASSARWTPSGRQIVYSTGHDLMIVDSDGSNPRSLLSVSGFPDLPAWSPDGRTMRFSVNTASGNQQQIWEAAADGKNLHRLFADPGQFQMTCCGRWTPDGRYFIFTARKEGTPELWALQEKSPFWRRRLSQPTELTESPDEIWYPVTGRDSRTVFAFTFRPAEEVERISLPSGKTSPVIDISEARSPFFSKDGKWIAYVSGTPRTLWRSSIDGKDRLQLTDESMNAFESHWSPDGKRIVFVAQVAQRPWKAFTVLADGGKPQPVLPQFNATGRADWSPDGKMMVLEARKEPTPEEFDPEASTSLFLLDLATGEATKLPGSDGFLGPRWSPDGKHIAATNNPNDSVMIYDLAKRQWTKAGTGTYLSALAWSKDSRYLYYQDLLGKDEPIYRLRLEDLRRETIFDFHELLSGNVFRCGFNGLDPSGSPIITLSLSDSDIYAIDLDLP